MSDNKKKDITALFSSPQAGDLGVDSKVSDLLITNLNATNLPMCVGTPVSSLETDDVTIVMFFIDASPSMEPVRQLLIDTFNQDMIGGLRGASRNTANTIVVGGLAFSSSIWPLWGGGFQKLSELPDLKLADYDPSRGNLTNLYQAQLDAITAVVSYATQVFSATNTPPRVIVAGLTDGADNLRRVDPDKVKAATAGLSKELFSFPLAVFETGERVDGNQIARETGFQVFNFKREQNETTADVQRRFRHMVGTFSSSVIRASQAQVGSGSQSFWAQPQQ